MHRPLSLALVFAVSYSGVIAQEKKAEPKTEVKEDAKKSELKVIVDVSETPDLKEWSDKAKSLVETWHPKIAELLKSDGYKPPMEVTIAFKKDQKIIAFASGKKISISQDWIKKHPDDFGMVAHELTHIIQQYRRAPREAGWLVEGIADYIRFYKYEPDAKIGRINPEKAKYTDSYRTAAQFLNWITTTHDKEIVAKLNRALREGTYQIEMFQQATGKNVDELWGDFVKTLKK